MRAPQEIVDEEHEQVIERVAAIDVAATYYSRELAHRVRVLSRPRSTPYPWDY